MSNDLYNMLVDINEISEGNNKDDKNGTNKADNINKEESNEIVLKDLFNDSLKDLEEFDEKAWSKGTGYLNDKFKIITEKLEGLDSGLYLIAAESNVGKSAFLLELIETYSTNPDNKLFGLYFSVDDSKDEIIPRLIAKNMNIPIGVASKPGRYEQMIEEGAANSANYQDYLEKREEGLKQLKENVDKFKIFDSNDFRYIEDIEEVIEKVQIYVKTVDPEANLIVGIDAINDLRFKNQTFNSDRSKHDEAAVRVKDWTVAYDIPVFANCHLSKGDGRNARPTLSRIKESVEYVYEASVIWLLHNDVGINGQSAKVYREEEGTSEKFPILELDWAKNKKSSYKGRTFMYFSPEYSKLEEVDEDTSTRYNALVYEG